MGRKSVWLEKRVLPGKRIAAAKIIIKTHVFHIWMRRKQKKLQRGWRGLFADHADLGSGGQNASLPETKSA
jgi:hypothetical protein